MANPDDVMRELNNNDDLCVVYDGAQGLFPEGGRRTGSLRYVLFKLGWDLLRFQKIKDFGTFDATAAHGVRDQVTRILLLTEQNNVMLRKLCAAGKIDLGGGLPGG
jgi:hypothetical protein